MAALMVLADARAGPAQPLALAARVGRAEQGANGLEQVVRLADGEYETGSNMIAMRKLVVKGSEKASVGAVVAAEAGEKGELFKLEKSSLSLRWVGLRSVWASVAEVGEESRLGMRKCEMALDFGRVHAVVNRGGFVELSEVQLVPVGGAERVLTLVKGMGRGGEVRMFGMEFEGLSTARGEALVTDSCAEAVVLEGCVFRGIREGAWAAAAAAEEEEEEEEKKALGGAQACRVHGCRFEEVENGLYGCVVMGMLGGGAVEVEECTFDSCKTSGVEARAAGIAAAASAEGVFGRASATYRSNTFKNLHSTGSGGAIYFVSSGTLTISSCRFEECSAEQSGGAVAVEPLDGSAGSVEIASSSFKTCSASLDGGVLFVGGSGAGSVVVKSSSMQKCSAGGRGGGVCMNGTLVLKSSEVKEASAGCGGGVHIEVASGVSEIVSSTIKDANSSGRGGCVYVGEVSEGARLEMRSSDVKRGRAEEEGGCVHLGKVLKRGSFVCESTTIKDGVTGTNGGCLFVESVGGQGKFTMKSSDVNGGEAKKGRGGGIFFSAGQKQEVYEASERPQMIMNYMMFSGNEAQSGGKDIEAEEGWSTIITEKVFYRSYSMSEQPRVYVEGTGDMSNVLPDAPFKKVIIAAVVAFIVVAAVVAVGVVLCACFCPCCACCACCPCCRQYKLRKEKEEKRRTRLMVNGSSFALPAEPRSTRDENERGMGQMVVAVDTAQNDQKFGAEPNGSSVQTVQMAQMAPAGMAPYPVLPQQGQVPVAVGVQFQAPPMQPPPQQGVVYGPVGNVAAGYMPVYQGTQAQYVIAQQPYPQPPQPPQPSQPPQTQPAISLPSQSDVPQKEIDSDLPVKV
ncbi:uncharacterized protein MONOS_15429 [Monocercomonoides exilis]|uniref:uncharacterized protein n=1 Tax=Monocercomonoides exilis TaxID=2049356 RepID=UPI00355982AC|nr:hypothetical protein MONOS_15429 [Monocercomonoides exilis]